MKISNWLFALLIFSICSLCMLYLLFDRHHLNWIIFNFFFSCVYVRYLGHTVLEIEGQIELEIRDDFKNNATFLYYLRNPFVQKTRRGQV